MSLRINFLEEDLEEVYSEVTNLFETSYKALKSVEHCHIDVKDYVLSQIMATFNKVKGLNSEKVNAESTKPNKELQGTGFDG